MTQADDAQSIHNRFIHLNTALTSTFALAQNTADRDSGRLLPARAEALITDVVSARDIVHTLVDELLQARKTTDDWREAYLHTALLDRALGLFTAYLRAHINVNDPRRRFRSLDKYGAYQCAELALYRAADLVIERIDLVERAIVFAAGRARRRRVSIDVELPKRNKYLSRLGQSPAEKAGTENPGTALPAGTSPTSRVLAACAIRMLPSLERARYREEFGYELYALCTRPRRAQIAYSVRLVLRALSLRQSLIEAPPTVPVRESAQ